MTLLFVYLLVHLIGYAASTAVTWREMAKLDTANF